MFVPRDSNILVIPKTPGQIHEALDERIAQSVRTIKQQT